MKLIKKHNLLNCENVKYYLMYCGLSSYNLSCLLLIRIDNNRYKNYGRVDVKGFNLDHVKSDGYSRNLREDSSMYELSEDEVNYHILVDNL